MNLRRLGKHLLGQHNQRTHGRGHVSSLGFPGKYQRVKGGTGEKPTGFAAEAINIVERLKAKIAKLRKEKEKLNKRQEEISTAQVKIILDALGNSLSEPPKDQALEAEFDEVIRQQLAMAHKIAIIQNSAKELIHKHFEIPPDKQFKLNPNVTKREKSALGTERVESDPTTQKSIDKGAEFLSRMVSASVLSSVMADGAGVVVDPKTKRASFEDWASLESLGIPKTDPKIFINPDDDAGTVIHEFGHFIEHSNQLIGQASQNFKTYRRHKEIEAEEKLKTHDSDGVVSHTPQSKKLAAQELYIHKPLSELTGNQGYKEHELSFKDHWLHPYMGKFYPPSGGRVGATEILSMGLQFLYEDPIDLAQRDPEMFNFVINAIQQGRPAQKPKNIRAKK